MQATTLKFIKKLSALSARSTGTELSTALASVEEELATSETSETCIDSADRYFYIFKLVFDTKSPELMEIALSAVHILIQRGFMLGKGSFQVGDLGNNKTENSSGSEYQENSDAVRREERARRSSVSKKPSVPRRDIDFILENVSKCSEVNDDGVHLQTLKVILTAVTSMSCEVHEATLLLTIQACFHIHLVSKNPVNKMTAKAALTQMVSSINSKMELVQGKEDYFGEAETVKASPPIDEDAGGIFVSIAHKDSYLVFRALCKLSMKGLYDDSDLANATRNVRGSEWDASAVAIQNKILSLELILHILQTCGPAFQSGDKFCEAIRKYLCISFLGNCTSQIVQVSSLSTKIFMALLQKFKYHLKTEFEIIFTSIFFKILESENSPS
jgi:hypothetical protein